LREARRWQGVADGAKAPAAKFVVGGLVLAQKKTALAPKPRGAASIAIMAGPLAKTKAPKGNSSEPR
jgi:hypothetical protein